MIYEPTYWTSQILAASIWILTADETRVSQILNTKRVEYNKMKFEIVKRANRSWNSLCPVKKKKKKKKLYFIYLFKKKIA